MNFSERLAELRKKKGLSQKECASELKLDSTKYNKWERGKNTPDYETIKALAKYFDTTTDFLLGASNVCAKPEKLSEYPELNALAAKFSQMILPLFEDMGDAANAYVDLFERYILDGVKQRVNWCRTCYEKRELFATPNGDIDAYLMELFVMGKYNLEKE